MKSKKKQSSYKMSMNYKRNDSDSLPVRPRNKPLPRFKSYEEEVRFWHSYQFEDPPESESEQVTRCDKVTPNTCIPFALER